jgi:hypothetical protein
MIDELAVELPNYGGRAGHTRCFLHTVNLVAKSVLREFDVKKGDGGEGESWDDQESDGVGKGDDEGLAGDTSDASENDNDDDIDGLVDAATILNAEEQRELQSSVRPVKDALAKVST